MNYCVLNGVKSTLIQGLMIQSLPPISKPLMRTSVEEIDGRDGDIITKLGYSAYDKEMTIGLYGDFDIDRVIQYFDSEGTVIFSNEPDKFYHYQIVNQIDFERLIRFRTATVTFHVQPFKFSAVDDAFSFSINQLSLRVHSEEKNGVKITSLIGKITLEGTASEDTELYLPINDLTLNAGNYTLKGATEGTGESACMIRVIGNVPTDSDSFGETYLQLRNDGTASLSAYEGRTKTYHYIWFYITSGAELDFVLNAEMLNNDLDSCVVYNRGNTLSRPSFTLFGSGNVTLSINAEPLFIVNIDDDYITLNGQEMNAYHGETLKNRQVQGDYSNLKLKQGRNTISWVGNITQIEVENVSRWI